MKKILLFLILIFGIYTSAQSESKKQTTSLSQQSEFPGGDQAFMNEFMRMVYAYVDTSIYAVNGKFIFQISISKDGKTSILNIAPKVKNYQMFFEDMGFALKRVKKKWKPATKDGVQIESSRIFEINFTTDYADHGD